MKSIVFYWRRKIADYQLRFDKSGAERSRKLKRMYERSKLQFRYYINAIVGYVVKRLYGLVSKIVVGYPKEIADGESWSV